MNTIAGVAGVASLASERGVICALALDHRQAFVNALAKVGVLEPTQDEMVATKSRVIVALAGDASAILVDQLTATAVDDLAPPLVLPLEAQGATLLDGGRINRLEFSAAQNAEAGAAACKLLVHYRSDHVSTAARQRELVQDAIEQCRAVDLPLVLEPIVYRLATDEDPGFELHFGELVVAAARDLAALRPSLMKMEYPGEGFCNELTAVCAPVPWVLLGGGDADGETFARRLEGACSAGASGFMAGRVVWGVALGLDPAAQGKTLGEVAQPLFRRLAAIADEAARPVASI